MLFFIVDQQKVVMSLCLEHMIIVDDGGKSHQTRNQLQCKVNTECCYNDMQSSQQG